LEKAGLPASVAPDGIGRSDVVLSLVTPAAALEAAIAVAPHLKQGAIYVDLNSVSGQATVDIAGIVEAQGARFVDAAVMGPVPLLKLQVPIILSVAAAAFYNQLAKRRGFQTCVLSRRPGDASSLKMLWSVITKGTIALFTEALVAAHRLELLEPLIGMLGREYGPTGSPAMITRLLSSTTVSGSRRLDEMREVRKVLAGASVPAWTVEATEKWIGELSRITGVRSLQNVERVVAAVSDGLKQERE